MIAMFAAAALGFAPSCRPYAAAASPGDARRAGAALARPLRPDQVGAVLASPDWRLVWVRPADAEPGVVIFRLRDGALRHVQTRGGVVDDRAEALRWATREAAVPAPLAACFVDQLMKAGP